MVYCKTIRNVVRCCGEHIPGGIKGNNRLQRHPGQRNEGADKMDIAEEYVIFNVGIFGVRIFGVGDSIELIIGVR